MNTHKAIEHKNKFNLPKIEKITAKILPILEQYFLNFTRQTSFARCIYLQNSVARDGHDTDTKYRYRRYLRVGGK